MEAGERVFITGASGSGKSTFLNLLSGILRPQQGSVMIAGTALHTLGARACDRFRARHIGLVFQQFNLVPWLSVEANIRLAARFAGGQAPPPSQIDELLQALRLPLALRSQRADRLSVGQQQRVAVARALVNQPSLLIADEPSSALDADSRAAFMALLLQVQAEAGTSILCVSHDPALAPGFDRVLDMRDLNQAAVRGATADAA